MPIQPSTIGDMAENRSLWGVCAYRITPLVACLPPAAGSPTALTYESVGVMSIVATPDIKDGIDDTQENGCGGVCAIVKTCDVVKSHSLTGEVCSLCPDMLAGAIGLEAILNGLGEIIGFSSGNSNTGCQDVLLEVWSKATTSNGQLCTPTGDEYIKFVFPRTSLMAPITFDLSAGFNTISLTGDSVSNPLLTPAIMEAAFPGSTGGAVAWDLDSSIHVFTTTDAPFANPTCEARAY